MDCPACNNSLSQIEIDEIKVDICKGGCGGVWFDTFEFKKFDEPHEAAGAELLDIEVNPSIKVDHSERRNCPKCDDITLMRNFFSIKKDGLMQVSLTILEASIRLKKPNVRQQRHYLMKCLDLT